ncbi:MAG TPA: RdgB/HAM1 family non-canonical purine NTP pyrophosphatase [Gammaproteobacteria bacterium]|jgi:XTP/dITP diphosphohydrolase|nr:RdgB/HAM1 family non-canonical purine NTP pyrophosphatase [Gammaproteobacteria bacterium]HIF85235.1 RdgB/HAM1 family non-canonical purine NTP pyrophosphatase [Gammaproteobacteria bacterium]HIL62358.1 RdgB/HAM1 family non-canonical purine NTP pyrophosphatase [Porticoccaceae bacterium]|tara:strand:+ start:14826 stop:15437 length:612 start_codon:yes stop_codon:yes gene_type:complete
MQKIILASGNAGKLIELQQILAEKKIELLPQADFAVSDVEETGLSFVENALIKARHACLETGLSAIADDSGIEVDALNGEPGIHSARYADLSDVSRDVADKANNQKLLSELEQVSEADRSARFLCVIVFLRHASDPMPLICAGTWEGRVLFSETGENGFGYDSLFYVPTHDCASAQLSAEIKNSISHRGQALRALMRCWNFRP